MKLGKIVENVIVIFFFLVVISYPWIATWLGVTNNLSGAEEKVKLSPDTIDEYIIQNFPGREFLVRTKNQLLYSFFDVSPNSSITKIDDTLISTETLNYYYHGLHAVDEKDVDALMDKLHQVNEMCKSKDKKLMVLLTPTKVRYYKGRLPFADDIILAYQEDYGKRSYEKLQEKLWNSDINFFDCISYINNNYDSMTGGEVPLFYNSGHHWSHYKGNIVGLAVEHHMIDTMKINMPSLSVYATPSDVAVYPDSDLFNVLNIYDKPNEQFYSSEVIFNDFNCEEHTYTIQGGSFLGSLLFPYITITPSSDVIHIENKAALYDGYKKNIQFTDYDDLNDKIGLLNHLKKTDIIVLEINELNVYNATFGFADYLLEHEKDI